MTRKKKGKKKNIVGGSKIRYLPNKLPRLIPATTTIFDKLSNFDVHKLIIVPHSGTGNVDNICNIQEYSDKSR